MDATPVYFEVNLDVSHYNFRQIKHDQSPALRKIFARVGALSLAIFHLFIPPTHFHDFQNFEVVKGERG